MQIERQMKSQKQIKVYIIGAGGHGQVVADALLSIGITPAGFLDDNEVLFGKTILDIPVLGKVSEAKNLDGRFIVAIGDNSTRKRIVERLSFPDRKYFTVVHHRAIIAKGVKIGAGSMIIGGVVINTGTVIGKHTIINTSVSVDHHNVIGGFVHIAPGSHTGGAVKVKEGAFLGIGVSVIPGKTIGNWAVIGAGASVITDIPDNVTAVGVPARVIKGGNK